MLRVIKTGGGLLLALMLGACSNLLPGQDTSRFISEETHSQGLLSEQTVALNASGQALPIERAVLLTDNDDAFAAKLELIESANESLDLAYYIFADDYSSSTLAVALIEAAKRGVRVRLLLDYHSNYARLDQFSMMELRGNSGEGSLEVRFFNRPSKNIVKDAVYLTMGCNEPADADSARCSTVKFAEIEHRFSAETIDGTTVSERNISNLNVGGSGLFLSGLYGKNPQLMALAISSGQGIDPNDLQNASSNPEDIARLKKLGQTYFRANYGSGLDRAMAQVQLSLAGLVYSEQVDPIYNAFTGFLPVERGTGTDEARRDWRYITEYLHHKLLLADGRNFQLGGRNIEDSYHMAPNRLTDKYVFRDTDLQVSLREPVPALRASFDRLWGFDLMVAKLADVRRHAPNDFLVATNAASNVCKGTQGQQAKAACLERALAKAKQQTLAQRLAKKRRQMLANAREFKNNYSPNATANRSPQFNVDADSVVHYVENLPSQRTPGNADLERRYGARNGFEGDSGKHIHALWLAALREACTLASAERPQRVILHNAYFFPPTNLLAQVARMVDGSQDCGDVTITVLTNSVHTTDLNVVNIAARHQIKAFAEFAQAQRDSERGARFEYFEYRAPKRAKGSRVSLHSKVLIAGPNMFVGSANADVRSYMMDTNNGLLIRNAPQLVATYSRWVQSLLDDAALTTDMGNYFVVTPRPIMLEEDRQTVRAELAKYRAERWITDPAQEQRLEDSVVRILDEIYSETQAGLSSGVESGEAREDFNELFKTL